MANASIDHVKAAIRASGATGNAAEVLASITAKTVERTNSELQTSRGLTLVLGPEATATALGGLKTAGQANPLLDSIYIAVSTTGLDFANPVTQQMIDQLIGAGVFSAELGAALKVLGRWQESPLEVAASQRGVTTDENTVQAVLDEIAEESSQSELRQKVTNAYNSVAAKVDTSEIMTVEAVLALFTSVIQG